MAMIRAMDESAARIPSEQDGARLDKALETLLPQAGLRQRRRMCDEGLVHVDGAPRRSSYRVSAGQLLEVLPPDTEEGRDEPPEVRVLKEDGGFAAVYKPEGVHSAAIAGRDNLSVESLLPRLFPEREAVLLNRLDNPTSGIVLVALDSGAVDRYRRCEESGMITKEYYARVHGRLMHSVTVKNRLDMAGRKKTRVLDEDDPDARRWTEVEPIEFGMESDTTLVRCVIRKGARHQIRAHLASLGHPILGDALYGSHADARLHLHHQRIAFDSFEAESPAPF
ncbi:RluA family pseudouridine synthase [Salidesulfovibrio onnuriiensis]|uniref:RluA family pseudouridine synthase n=1 Tax=Salidesulfovibrio onnuriiensis TaxID=2583823 RepID=UPI00202ACE90|nr:RluA family pseudouridine synthase [Salidesulfovibrio onnuriiensis]